MPRLKTLPMTDEERAMCERYRPVLVRELADIEALLAANTENAAPVQLDQQSVGRLARMNAMQVQAMAQEAARRRSVRKLRIQAALARMDEGEFGYCKECAERISEARLRADPTFHRCVACYEH